MHFTEFVTQQETFEKIFLESHLFLQPAFSNFKRLVMDRGGYTDSNINSTVASAGGTGIEQILCIV